MRIETNRLIIRELEASDEKFFIKMASDGSLEKDIGFDANCSEWMKRWIAESKKLADKDDPTVGYLAYAVQLKHSETVIGSVGCSYYKDLQKVGITYFIGADYRNRGYALESVKAYIQYFFRHYNTHEIIATIREGNISSWKVVENAGFNLTERKMYKDINDDREEMYRFYVMIN
ncbi:MAG: GNAT family N-acetyltransferase [Oscillospiraceae bacterium]|nr:GNAT family N-acetyltransferase [Oscillospiraceae bacterium]